jgi:hypothetical protein
MTFSELEDFPLHDATLRSLEVLWKEAHCKLFLMLSTGPHVLTFTGVTSVIVPRKNEWGRSVSIYEVKCSDGVAFIQMQSGDMIEIAAQAAELAVL